MDKRHMLELLKQARAETYDEYEKQRREMLEDERVPMEAINKLVMERNNVWKELSIRIRELSDQL